MDIDKLIEDLRGLLKQYGEKIPYGEMVGAPWPYSRAGDLVWQDPEPYFIEQAATALSTLQAENEKLRAELEQVKKVFPGCEMCREKKKVKSDNFCGAATMQIVGDSIDLCGDKKKIKFFGHIYAPSFSVKFCPFCSRPLTDEAVQMVMERLEALHENP